MWLFGSSAIDPTVMAVGWPFSAHSPNANVGYDNPGERMQKSSK
jgi:hypothetical protein